MNLGLAEMSPRPNQRSIHRVLGVRPASCASPHGDNHESSRGRKPFVEAHGSSVELAPVRAPSLTALTSFDAQARGQEAPVSKQIYRVALPSSTKLRLTRQRQVEHEIEPGAEA